MTIQAIGLTYLQLGGIAELEEIVKQGRLQRSNCERCGKEIFATKQALEILCIDCGAKCKNEFALRAQNLVYCTHASASRQWLMLWTVNGTRIRYGIFFNRYCSECLPKVDPVGARALANILLPVMVGLNSTMAWATVEMFTRMSRDNPETPTRTYPMFLQHGRLDAASSLN